jgi:hypothetical protein
MDTAEACRLIEEYRDANGHLYFIDAAKAMVADYYYLSHTEREAVDVFMSAGRKMFAPA